MLADVSQAVHGDERAEHIVRSFADEVQPGVAHHPLEGLIGEEARPAPDLQAVIDDPPQGIAGEDFDHRGFQHVILGPAVDQSGRVIGRAFHRISLRGGEGDFFFDQFKLAQRLPELPAGVRPLDHLLQAKLRGPGATRPERGPPEVQNREREFQSFADLP